jgi:hypothetical protein
MDLSQPEIDRDTKQQRRGNRDSVGAAQPADLCAADEGYESSCRRSDSADAGGTMRKDVSADNRLNSCSVSSNAALAAGTSIAMAAPKTRTVSRPVNHAGTGIN